MTKKSPSITTKALQSQGVRHQRLADRVRALTTRVAVLEEDLKETEQFINDLYRIRKFPTDNDEPSE